VKEESQHRSETLVKVQRDLIEKIELSKSMTVDQTVGEVNRLRDQLKVLAKERAEDLESISELVSTSQKKTLSDLERTKQHLESFISSQREDLM